MREGGASMMPRQRQMFQKIVRHLFEADRYLDQSPWRLGQVHHKVQAQVHMQQVGGRPICCCMTRSSTVEDTHVHVLTAVH